MSSEYQRKWRRRRARVDALVEHDSSSESEGSVEPVLVEEGDHFTEESTCDEFHPMEGCSSSIGTAAESLSDSTKSEPLDEPLHSTVETPSLHNDLASWATATNQTHKALNELLHVLRRHGHRLPKDARSLLDTPKGVPVQNKCNGQYIYYGIERYLLEHFLKETLPGQVKLCFNVDGVPLFKSSKMCVWPILGQIQNSQPFIVALFYGSSKPDSVEEFLQDFVEELQQLIQNGISFQNLVHSVTVKAIICDAQARAFLKCIKSHNSLHGCERCVAVAQKIEGRVVYLTKGPTEERRDEVFSQAGYSDHQKQISPLVRAGILCVKQFPLDYMHLVCLEAMKRLLTYLWRGPDICRLSKAQSEQVEKNISQLKGALLAEFSRQPRSMEELDRWKATELRQFVLYTGPSALHRTILKDVLLDDQYHHFLCLSVGMTILLDEDNTKDRCGQGN
ncbi:Acylphosphatase [Labeo rohita]|uniref:Acylphosphatase n=1 Tax=Labeo rohita TaxID=84645 RepID=A0ABQ8L0J5_LABRO|nr:Acylphosphatase [Labeo rohita]